MCAKRRPGGLIAHILSQRASSRVGALWLPGGMRWRGTWAAASAALAALVLAGCSGGEDAALPELQEGVRVYDATGDSLTDEQVGDLDARAEELGSTAGADVVLLVRELDASPEDTLDQAEELQQAWVEQTGAEQDVAVAILVNREPGEPEEARAGIFVGSTFEDGNVPSFEQEQIVEDALIPPLRDGDVQESLSAGLTSFAQSAADPPRESAANAWARSVTDGPSAWGTWSPAVLALLLTAVGARWYAARPRGERPEPEPTTTRPGDLPPGLAATLATGDIHGTGLSGTVVDLARRGAIVLEPEERKRGQPAVGARLVDRSLVDDTLGEQAWQAMERKAEDGVIGARELRGVLSDTRAHRLAVRELLQREGVLDAAARRRRTWLAGLGLLLLVLGVLVLVLAVMGRSWWPVPGMGVLAVCGSVLLIWAVRHQPFTANGMELSVPWRGYRAGLQQAADPATGPVDVDAVLPDVLAIGLGPRWKKRLEAAEDDDVSSSYLRTASGLPMHGALAATLASSTSSTVSGGGAGGGGGAAGST